MNKVVEYLHNLFISKYMAQIIRKGEISSDKLVRLSTEEVTSFP